MSAYDLVEDMNKRMAIAEARFRDTMSLLNKITNAPPLEINLLAEQIQELTRRLDSFQDEYGKAPSVALLMRRFEALEETQSRHAYFPKALSGLQARVRSLEGTVTRHEGALNVKRPETAIRKNVRCYQCGGCTAPVVVYQKIYICEACLKRGLELLAALPKPTAEPRVDETIMGDPDDERRVAHTFLSDGKWISTVFVPDGLSGGPYETMVFPSREDLCELDCARYATYEEAVVGHEEMVAKWKAKIPS